MKCYSKIIKILIANINILKSGLENNKLKWLNIGEVTNKTKFLLKLIILNTLQNIFLTNLETEFFYVNYQSMLFGFCR